jgi:hypothetical protein
MSKMEDRYNYDNLRERAVKHDATQKDINALGEWFSRYGDAYWNGEYYDADNGVRLFPIFAYDEEDEVYYFTGNFEFK